MLTPEQVYAIEYFRRELPEKLIAFAGSGKTSTLKHMAKQVPHRRGFYLAFNKSIATEAAQEFPRTVTCRTTHSVAFGTIARQGFDADNKLMKTPRSKTFDLSTVRDKLPMNADTFRSIVATTLQRFCQSDSKMITERHAPRVPGLSDEDQEFVYQWAPDAASAVWDRMIDPRCDFPLGSDGYVKLWALGNPRIFGDYIMVDEAQDLNPVLIGVIRNQPAQIVAVGDSHQQIYEWRGARDALMILPGHECRLTRSFRFGEQIAAAANGVLEAMGEQFPLQGFSVIKDQVVSTTQGVDAVLCRSNAGVIETAIGYIDSGVKVATPGGTGEMRALVEDAQSLKNDLPARSPSLMGFTNWKDVEEYSETDEGRSLKVFVRLVGKYGTTKLARILDQIKDKAELGTITVATAHKSKGLQWPVVAISEDFLTGDSEDSRISVAERRLFYVAITRAQRVLSVDPGTLEAFSTPDEDAED